MSKTPLIIRRVPAVAARPGNVCLRYISSQPKRPAPQAFSIRAADLTLTTPASNNTRNKNPSIRHPFSSSANLEMKVQKLQPSRTVIHSENDLLVDMEALQELASQPPTPLRLSDMYKYAVKGDSQQRLRNAQFLYRELPIRIAQRAVDLLTLPHGLNSSEPIKNVAHIYLRYLELFEKFPTPTTLEDEEAFTAMLTGIMLDRTSIPMDIARGIQMWSDERHQDLRRDESKDIQEALYRFFTARVGLRFLTEHHILSSTKHKDSTLRNDHLSPNDFLGCIQTDCNPVLEVSRVAAEVTRQTKDHYGICPDIEIINCSGDSPSSFTYVPHHLQYMIAELLKNSCRATVRNYRAQQGGLNGQNFEIPSIRVIVVNGAEDVSIKIADRGGGVPRSTMKEIFRFAHSTADREEDESDFGTDEITGGHIRGFGLPLARIYARYFGGELTLKSMEGYGLDAYLYLPRLGEACENLPLSVKASPGEQVSMPTGRGNYANWVARQSG